MSKKVVIITGKGAFETLQEAADACGKSVSTISRALRDFNPDIRQVDRVYIVKVKDLGWRVAVMASTNRAYIPLDQGEKKIPVKNVEQIKDVTLAWYGICCDGER